jgi:hypothetical protein
VKGEKRKMTDSVAEKMKSVFYKSRYYGWVYFPYEFEIEDGNFGVAVIIRDVNGKSVAKIWIK